MSILILIKVLLMTGVEDRTLSSLQLLDDNDSQIYLEKTIGIFRS